MQKHKPLVGQKLKINKNDFGCPLKKQIYFNSIVQHLPRLTELYNQLFCQKLRSLRKENDRSK